MRSLWDQTVCTRAFWLSYISRVWTSWAGAYLHADRGLLYEQPTCARR